MNKFCIKIKHTTSFALTAALVFYQLFLPFTLVRVSADETPTDNQNVNENSNDNDNKEILKNSDPESSSGLKVRDDKVENSNVNDNNSNDNETKPAETCDVKDSELTDYCQEDLKCGTVDKCLVDYSCSEIKKCLSVKVENQDNANINDNVSTDANSGENTITQEDNVNINDNTDYNTPPPAGAGYSSQEETGSQSPLERGAECNEAGRVSENLNSNDNSSPESNATIDAGDAAAQAVVFNEVNTTVVSDNHQETVINITGTYDGDINLLDQFQALQENNPQEAPESNGGLVVIENGNLADLDTTVTVEANSGDNAIVNENGNAQIQAGDATAVSDTVNVVNTTIVGNNVLFAVINVYGEWNGDLVVPGEGLLEVSPEPVYAETVISNENDVNINNNVTTTANTGEDTITQEGSGNTASIESGAAIAATEVVNIVNTTIVKNNFFFLMINNMGSWTGKLLNWDEDSKTYSNIFSYDFGVLGDGVTPTIEGILAIFNKNNANIDNNITVDANSGRNTIDSTGNGNNASIISGNATAQAKILNFINTNIIGNNWLFAIVNVMGKWNGDAVFAYPDLAISISDGKDQVSPGDNLDYTVTYKNNGKAACDNVNIMVTLPQQTNGGDQNFSLAGLKPGEERSFNVSAQVNNDVPEGNTPVEAAAGINTGTKEVEMGNNMGTDSTIVYRAAPVQAATQDKQIHPSLAISRKTDGKNEFDPGDTAKFVIFVENTGDAPLHDVTVNDEMKSKKIVVGRNSWNLGEMTPGRKLKIEYKIKFNDNAPAVKLENTASGFGFDENQNKVTANSANQKIAINGTEYPESQMATANNGSIVTYYTSQIIGGMCYLDEWPVLNQAQAEENPTFLAAAEDGNAVPSLPLWIWLAAALSYFLLINWSLFPKKKALLPGTELGTISRLIPEEEEVFEDEWPAYAEASAGEKEVELETENNEQKNG